MSARACQSETYGPRTYCGRCDLSWASNAKPDDIPLCKDKATPPISLDEIRNWLERQAQDEFYSQSAIVKAGISVAPDKRTLRKIAVLRAGVELIERCSGDAEIMRRLREG